MLSVSRKHDHNPPSCLYLTGNTTQVFRQHRQHNQNNLPSRPPSHGNTTTIHLIHYWSSLLTPLTSSRSSHGNIIIGSRVFGYHPHLVLSQKYDHNLPSRLHLTGNTTTFKVVIDNVTRTTLHLVLHLMGTHLKSSLQTLSTTSKRRFRTTLHLISISPKHDHIAGRVF